MNRTMERFEEFEQQLRQALAHLYDPAYHPPEVLRRVTGCNWQEGVEAVQATLIQAIQNLKPASDIPAGARIRRVYDLLAYRYLQELTQEEAAQRLGITARHLRREQQQAVEVLARRLWEQRDVDKLVPDDHGSINPSPELAKIKTESKAWHSQVRQELVSLQKNAPGMVADVGEAVQAVVKLTNPLASNHHVELTIESIQPGLITTLHPSVLHQLLITAVEKLVQHMSSGSITFRAERAEQRLKITITGEPVVAETPIDSALIREILLMQGGAVELDTAGQKISFQVEAPSAGKVTVLVVDDNADLVHFYRRYTTGTRYQIIHSAEGRELLEVIEQIGPDIIVLDVMLPDVDGWELLAQLRDHPATRATPVIVCSVVRREELALALGAALYVPKPVRRQQFIQALEQVLAQALAKAPRAQANSEAIC